MPAPNKLFDVSNGNGAVVNAETVVRGTLIWYKDNAAKDQVIDRFCTAYGYQDTIPNPLAGQNGQPATIPNPQSKQAFFNRALTTYIKDVVRSQGINAAAATAAADAATTEDANLP